MKSGAKASESAAPAPTVLQIVTSHGPAGAMDRERHGVGPGGPLGTWAGKLREVGCPSFVLMLLIGASIALSTGALIYANADSATTCLADWDQFAISYTLWLEVYGFSNLCMLIVGSLLIGIHGCSGTVCTSQMAVVFFVVAIAVKIGWYIVGACIYWRTVNGSCDDGSQIAEFGLALFILDFVLFSLAYCARKAQDMH